MIVCESCGEKVFGSMNGLFVCKYHFYEGKTKMRVQSADGDFKKCEWCLIVKFIETNHKLCKRCEVICKQKKN